MHIDSRGQNHIFIALHSQQSTCLRQVNMNSIPDSKDLYFYLKCLMEPGTDVEPVWFPSDFLKCSLKSCSYSLDQWVLNYFMLCGVSYLQESLQNTLEGNNKIFTEGMWFQTFADKRGGYPHTPCLSFPSSLIWTYWNTHG